jgi:hypothetical protein
MYSSRLKQMLHCYERVCNANAIFCVQIRTATSS